jgi:hypothetical protein
MIHARHLLLAAALGACTVQGSAAVGVETTPVVYQDPPPPQVERVQVRPGFVWVKGHYVWRNGQWIWSGGHWEHDRAGYAWNEGRWERDGNGWRWVDGGWVMSSQPPTATVTVSPAPPPPPPAAH